MENLRDELLGIKEPNLAAASALLSQSCRAVELHRDSTKNSNTLMSVQWGSSFYLVQPHKIDAKYATCFYVERRLGVEPEIEVVGEQGEGDSGVQGDEGGYLA